MTQTSTYDNTCTRMHEKVVTPQPFTRVDILSLIAAAEATPTNNLASSKKKRNKSKKKKQTSAIGSSSSSTSTQNGGKRGLCEGPAPAPTDSLDCWSSGEELEFHDAQSELPGESHDCHVIPFNCMCTCFVSYTMFNGDNLSYLFLMF